MIIIVMGVAGAGKSTIGRRLAADLGWSFIEADELHSPASIEKMRRGVALTDADRMPWLRAVRQQIEDADRRRESVVVACSALKQAYRDVIAEGLRSVRFVYLRADAALLEQRLRQRTGHFARVALLETQLGTLEEPDSTALTLDASAPPDVLVSTIRTTWHL